MKLHRRTEVEESGSSRKIHIRSRMRRTASSHASSTSSSSAARLPDPYGPRHTMPSKHQAAAVAPKKRGLANVLKPILRTFPAGPAILLGATLLLVVKARKGDRRPSATDPSGRDCPARTLGSSSS